MFSGLFSRQGAKKAKFGVSRLRPLHPFDAAQDMPREMFRYVVRNRWHGLWQLNVRGCSSR